MKHHQYPPRLGGIWSNTPVIVPKQLKTEDQEGREAKNVIFHLNSTGRCLTVFAQMQRYFNWNWLYISININLGVVCIRWYFLLFQDPDGLYWCSTKVNPKTRVHIGGKGFWGYCKPNCDNKPERNEVIVVSKNNKLC